MHELYLLGTLNQVHLFQLVLTTRQMQEGEGGAGGGQEQSRVFSQ